MNALNNIANIFGGMPLVASTTDKTFEKPIYGVEIWAATTFTKFFNEKGEEIITGWEGVAVTVDTGIKLILFTRPVSRITFSVCGGGQYLLAKPAQ